MSVRAPAPGLCLPWVKCEIPLPNPRPLASAVAGLALLAVHETGAELLPCTCPRPPLPGCHGRPARQRGDRAPPVADSRALGVGNHDHSVDQCTLPV